MLQRIDGIPAGDVHRGTSVKDKYIDFTRFFQNSAGNIPRAG
jgi:hypothetical protein